MSQSIIESVLLQTCVAYLPIHREGTARMQSMALHKTNGTSQCHTHMEN